MTTSAMATVDPWVWQQPYGYEGQLVGLGDIAAQARRTFANLAAVLEAAGSSLAEVVQLRVFLLDIMDLRAYGAVRDEMMSR